MSVGGKHVLLVFIDLLAVIGADSIELYDSQWDGCMLVNWRSFMSSIDVSSDVAGCVVE